MWCPSIMPMATPWPPPKARKRGKSDDKDVADADLSKSAKKTKDKEKEKASAKADKAAKEAEKSASKDAKESKGAVVAEAEPSKSSEAKKPAVDKTPTGNLKSGASQTKTPLTGAQADAAGTEPEFRWPARGRIIQGFKAGGNDGINISVPLGNLGPGGGERHCRLLGRRTQRLWQSRPHQASERLRHSLWQQWRTRREAGRNGQARAGDRQVRRYGQRQFAAASLRIAQGIDAGRSDELSRRPLRLGKSGEVRPSTGPP